MSSGTRAALEQRETADDISYAPTLFSRAEFVTLRALVDQVLPQRDSTRIDIAARLTRQLERSMGDGWRAAFDAAAYRGGLQTLESYAQAAFGVPYTSLADAQAHAILEAIASGAGVAHPSRYCGGGPRCPAGASLVRGSARRRGADFRRAS